MIIRVQELKNSLRFLLCLKTTVSGESNLDQALCIIGIGRGGFRVDGGKWEGRKQTNKSGSLNTKNGTRE